MPTTYQIPTYQEKKDESGEWVIHHSELVPKMEKELIIYCDEKKNIQILR